MGILCVFVHVQEYIYLLDNTKTGTIRILICFGRQMIPVDSIIKIFFERCCIIAFRSPVFDTTSPGGRAATDGSCGRTSRESHPSEDLSELPPLLEAVAGQEYHY